MQSRFLLALAGGGVVMALGGDALASPPLSNTCYDVGFACFNAGPAGDQPGTCEAATCDGLLDASYACGVCDLGADGGPESGAPDGGSPDASTPDGEVFDATSPEGGSGSDGAPLDATPLDGAAGATDGGSSGSGSSGGGSSGGGSSSGSTGGSSSGSGTGAGSSSGVAPDAAGGAEDAMPGCSASPASRPGPTGFALLALGVAAVARARRRRG